MTAQVTGIPGYIAGTWDIDPVHSHIGFEARHMFVSKVRGRFEKFSGQVVTAADPMQSSATLTVEMNSVSTGNQTRDDDLRSDNFFAAATYPVMTYRSTGIRRDGEALVLDGELTIRGVTRPVSLRFEVNGFTTDPANRSTRAGFSAAGEINRMDFGVCTNVPIGGGLASDKVRIDIEAGAVLRQPEQRRPDAGRRPALSTTRIPPMRQMVLMVESERGSAPWKVRVLCGRGLGRRPARVRRVPNRPGS